MEFLLNFKYAAMLTVLYVTMLYGSGIPILYVVATAFYFSSYWVDKFLLFRYFKRPLMMDQYLAYNTLKWFKYALVLHIIGGMLMYSNSAILPVKQTITSSAFGKQFSSYTKSFQFGTVTSKLMAIYIAVFASLIALYLVYRLFLLTLIKVFSRLCKNFKKRFLEVENFESDFYSCVSF